MANTEPVELGLGMVHEDAPDEFRSASFDDCLFGAIQAGQGYALGDKDPAGTISVGPIARVVDARIDENQVPIHGSIDRRLNIRRRLGEIGVGGDRVYGCCRDIAYSSGIIRRVWWCVAAAFRNRGKTAGGGGGVSEADAKGRGPANKVG